MTFIKQQAIHIHKTYMKEVICDLHYSHKFVKIYFSFATS